MCERTAARPLKDATPGARDAFADEPSVQLVEYESLNHALVPGRGPQVPEAYAVPNHVSEDVVANLADWTAAEL